MSPKSDFKPQLSLLKWRKLFCSVVGTPMVTQIIQDSSGSHCIQIAHALDSKGKGRWCRSSHGTLGVVSRMNGGGANTSSTCTVFSQTGLITSKGYPCENHYVTTEDGFILNMQRIPHGKMNQTPGVGNKTIQLHLILTSSYHQNIHGNNYRRHC